MRQPPLVWEWTWTRWVPVSARQRWVLWRALSQAQWSTAAQWRQQFLDFDREDRVVSSDLVEDFLEAIATPQQVIQVVGELMQEKRLLRRDAHALEDAVLRQVDHAGQWKQQRGRRQSACKETTYAGG